MAVRPSTRALFAVVALPILMMLERFAWYGTRSIQYIHLTDLGWSSAQMGEMYAVQSFILPGATLLSGLVALAVGPLPLIALGLLLAAAGYAMVPMFGADSVQLPIYLSAVGTSLFRPAVWAALLIPLARPRESGRIGACLLLYAAANVAGVAAPAASTRVLNTFGSGAAYGTAAGVAFLGLLVALAFTGGWLGTREEERAMPPSPSGRFELPVVLGAAGLGLLLFIPWTGLFTGYDAVWASIWELPFVQGYESIWMAVNPGVVVFVGLLLASIFLVLALLQKGFPALVLAGAGMILVSAGVILIAIGPVRETAWGFGVGFVLLSIGEVMAAPALISRIGGDVHWRLTTLFVALWLATSSLGYAASGLIRSSSLGDNPFGIPMAFAVIGVPIGIVLLVAAIPLQRLLFAPPEPEPSPERPAPAPVVSLEKL